MRCPKCGNIQKGTVECTRCGVIFARLREVKRRRKKEAKAALAEKERSAVRRRLTSFFLLCSVLLVCLGALVYLNWGSSDQVVADRAAPKSPAVKRVQQTPSDRSQQELDEENVIDRALAATVTIRTPLGTGSGFFISPDTIVTNRHVVRVDPKQVDKLKSLVAEMETYVSSRAAYLAKRRRVVKAMRAGDRQRQLAEELAAAETKLDEVRQQLDANRTRLRQLDIGVTAADIEVLLENGSNQTPASLEISDNRDLALLTIYSSVEKTINVSCDERRLTTGEKVFALGSPVGLAQTVTSGIFSGYRRNTSTDRLYLQTDAPINPGSSGGPLIDEKGCLQGVNTMIIRNTEGLGFAIPVEAIGEEFPGRL